MQPSPSATTFDMRAFRNALGCFPTGVAIVTAKALGEAPIGMTINSFSSVSLDPPLVLWSLRRNAFSRDGYMKAKRFIINVLRDDQETVALRFARPAEKIFNEGEVDHACDGTPRFIGCAATFECRTVDIIEGGDHLIMIGQVERFGATSNQPLVFCRGSFASLSGSYAADLRP